MISINAACVCLNKIKIKGGEYDTAMRKLLYLVSVAALAITVAVLASPRWSSAQFPGSSAGDADKGQRALEANCATCHGADGNSPDPQYPKLAGQNQAYLYEQLWAFKRGARRSEVMSGIVASLSDTDMAYAANFYSRQPRKPDTVKDRRLAAIGERIFFAGHAFMRHVPRLGRATRHADDGANDGHDGARHDGNERLRECPETERPASGLPRRSVKPFCCGRAAGDSDEPNSHR